MTLPGTGRRVRSALEDTEAALRRSAARLRACGQEDRARRAKRSAASVRFDLNEPLLAGQLHVATAGLRHIPRVEPLASQVLEKVLSLARADRGNVQLADPASGALRIIAQHGFGAEFLDHFAVVDDDFPAVIHHAAGMLSQQCGCGIGDALALLRARAFSVGCPAEEIAARVVRGELRLC